jgi:MbtH protein
VKDELFVVLFNEEAQYSLWPLGRDVPAGWKQIGSAGSKEQCKAFVDTNWTDMRPESLVKRN